jgi:hypothetical protein
MARALKLLRRQIESIVGRDDFRAIRQLEDLFRDVADTTLVLRSVTAAASVNAADDVVLADGTFNVTLPLAANSIGRPISIKNVGTGVVTIVGTGTDTIDGVASYVLAVPYQSVTVVGASSGVWVIL